MFVIDTTDNRFVNLFRPPLGRTERASERAGLSFVHGGGGLTGTQPDSPRPAPKFVFRGAEEEATLAVAVGVADDDGDDVFTAAAAAAAAAVVTVVVDVVGAECSPSR